MELEGERGHDTVATNKEKPESNLTVTNGEEHPEVADYEEDMFADAKSEYSEGVRSKGTRRKVFHQAGKLTRFRQQRVSSTCFGIWVRSRMLALLGACTGHYRIQTRL